MRMKKILKRAASILLTAALSMSMVSMAAFAEEAVTLELPVTIRISSSYKPAMAEELNIVLTAEDDSCPMPEGSENGTCRITIAGEGTKKLGAISYSKTGVHHYKIHQEAGTHLRGTYDSTVYHVTVYVTNAESGGLETTMVSYIDAASGKQGEVVFSNSYRKSSGSSSGGGGTPGGDPSSGGPGVTTEITDGVPPLTVIPEQEIALPMLPQTGTLWWIVPILALAGIVMFVVGFCRNRRGSHEEEI